MVDSSDLGQWMEYIVRGKIVKTIAYTSLLSKAAYLPKRRSCFTRLSELFQRQCEGVGEEDRRSAPSCVCEKWGAQVLEYSEHFCSLPIQVQKCFPRVGTTHVCMIFIPVPLCQSDRQTQKVCFQGIKTGLLSILVKTENYQLCENIIQENVWQLWEQKSRS